jgi:hypothetical protein
MDAERSARRSISIRINTVYTRGGNLTKACTGAAEENFIIMASGVRRPGDAKR